MFHPAQNVVRRAVQNSTTSFDRTSAQVFLGKAQNRRAAHYRAFLSDCASSPLRERFEFGAGERDGSLVSGDHTHSALERGLSGARCRRLADKPPLSRSFSTSVKASLVN